MWNQLLPFYELWVINCMKNIQLAVAVPQAEPLTNGENAAILRGVGGVWVKWSKMPSASQMPACGSVLSVNWCHLRWSSLAKETITEYVTRTCRSVKESCPLLQLGFLTASQCPELTCGRATHQCQPRCHICNTSARPGRHNLHLIQRPVGRLRWQNSPKNSTKVARE